VADHDGAVDAEHGRAAVLGFTMPLWATLLSILFLKERVTPRRIAGLAMGLCAMGLLLWPAMGAVGQELAGVDIDRIRVMG